MQRLSENNADGHFNSSVVRDRHFKFGPRPRIDDYDEYLVGMSWKKLTLTRLKPISIKDYGWYIYHFCRDNNLTTDQIVEKYSRRGQYSYDFQKLIEKFIFPIIEDVKKGLIAAQKASGAVSALKKFSIVNEITINWDYIRQFLPEINSNARDEAYTRQQIKDILECGIDLRLQVVVLFMCSGGLRREAMTGLRNGDVEPLYFNNKLLAAKVTAYNEDKDEYITFVSPEAYWKYDKYIKTREKYGEVVTKNSPVIIKKFDINGNSATIDNHPIAPSTLDGLMIAAAVKAGVREPSPYYKNRYKNKACHAFRKTFESVLLNTITAEGDLQVNPLIAVQLLGDSVKAELGVGVMEHYNRQDPLQRNPSDPNNEYSSLFHEYKKAVWDLTISDEERL